MEPKLIDEYVKTGKVRFEFRDYAFLGPESKTAAQAAVCADDQGQFWRMHDTIFLNHGKENSGALSADRLKAMAAQIGLDTAKFSTCLDGGAKAETVAAMVKEAQQKGISSTPTLVVNDKVVTWTGWDGLKAEIDKALGQGG